MAQETTISSAPHAWKRYGFAAVLGVALTFAFAPYFYLPLVVLAFSGLWLLSRNAPSHRQAFWTGWWFGFAHGVTALYWIANSLLVDAERFAWLIPLAVSLIPAYVALYPALVCYVCSRLPHKGVMRWLIFSLLWVIAELIRGHVMTGFGWNVLGYVWADTLPIMQFASIVGVYGLSLLTIVLATIPGLVDEIAGSPRKLIGVMLAVFVVISGLMMWGQAKLEAAGLNTTSTTIGVRVVQPNIAQSMKWDEQAAVENLEKHLLLTRQPFSEGALDMVVWPESAIPFVLDRDEARRAHIAESLLENTKLVLGGVRFEGTRERPKPYNSVFVMNADAEIEASYDKHHLVPFGEYIPLRQFIPFIETITHGGFQFQSGQGAQTIQVEDIATISPLICYEVMYSGDVADRAVPPELLVNITNDAWFGDSSGPHQHLAMARMRAVEEGVPLIRAANTGISAVIDAQGRVYEHIELNKADVIDIRIPVSSATTPRTFYATHGKITPIGIVMLLGLIIVVLHVIFYNRRWK